MHLNKNKNVFPERRLTMSVPTLWTKLNRVLLDQHLCWPGDYADEYRINTSVIYSRITRFEVYVISGFCRCRIVVLPLLGDPRVDNGYMRGCAYLPAGCSLTAYCPPSTLLPWYSSLFCFLPLFTFFSPSSFD
jgi:hypothetical protein